MPQLEEGVFVEQSALPRPRRALAMMLLPAVLLTALIVGYVVIVLGGAAAESELRRVLPVLIAAGHSVTLAVLLLVLRSEGRTLADAGWRLPPERSPGLARSGAGASEGASAGVGSGRGRLAVVGREVVVGLCAALALYLFKELVLDSILAWSAGRRPTFTTLFRFGAPVGEVGLLTVASTFVLVEEAVYRGYGLPPLVERWGAMPALLAMGLLFGLLHWGNGVLAILFTGVIGIGFGTLFLWRRTLLPVAVAHVVYNVLVILS